MKRLNIYMLFLATMVIVACDPMKETYDKMDENPAPITADLEIVLTADDYEDSGDDNAAKYGSFSSEEDAKAGIPNILDTQYPQLGAGSSAIVQYDLYAPIRMSLDTAHTLTAEDYDAIDEPYGSLSSLGDIFKATEYVIPNPEGGEVLELGYEWWTGSSTESRENTMSYYEGTWYIAYVPTTEDYYKMGQSYPNFDSRTTARNEIAGILNADYYISAEAGDYRTSVFTYTYVDSDDVRHFDNFLAVFAYLGGKWNAIQDVSPRLMQLGQNGETWVPDNTLKYPMAAADYDFVVEAYADINPAGVASMAQYGNYDLTIWASDEIQNSIADVLKNNFSSAAEGQKYLVSYSVWTGSSGDTHYLHMIKQGDGYVPFVE